VSTPGTPRLHAVTGMAESYAGYRPVLTGPHEYISTACLHGYHERCGAKQLARGDLTAPHCKFCPVTCACPVCRHDEQADVEARLTSREAA